MGNTKLGHIPSVSLLPVIDCGNCSACAKGCYAVKMQARFKNVRKAWGRNSDLAKQDRESYMGYVYNWCVVNSPEYFRWHIAGDILDQDYLEQMKEVAVKLPGTKFLCFTKMHHLDFTGLPENLTVVASMWPGLVAHPNVAHLPKAWMQDGTEERVPTDAIECKSSCEECNACWGLKGSVVFHEH